MLKTLAGIVGATMLVLPSSAQKPAIPQARESIASPAEAASSAIALCESSVTTGKMIGKFKTDVYTEYEVASRVKKIADLPALVTRFILTNGNGAHPSLVLNILTQGGGVWAIPRRGQASCDILITGFHDRSFESQMLSGFSTSAGWQVVDRGSKDPSAHLKQYYFIKRMPNAESDAFGVLVD
ncbi:hypothetical protein [Sphingomonas sanxanigenens]|uniref:hypothetical protein n=1 Tax=Sphingomonas sanxanigenens TaxID=397260 RepID=UPI001300EDEE|nr:hypothetical protein [Sphingomonas sanxanigenens]